MTQLQFLGATGTVTGSKYLLQHEAANILIDCGLFQGYKQLRLRNWKALPFDAKKINAVVLTHAHIDHSGYLPLLAKNGFTAPVYCTTATRDLCEILLPDSGQLQEEEAEYANRHGFSKHKPAAPLYTRADAERCLRLFKPIDFDEEIAVADDLSLRLRPSGHILGAALACLNIARSSIVFSGDLGRQNDLIMPAPASVGGADYLVVESTYGNRSHNPSDPQDMLADVINRTVQRGGVVVIPTFAVGRAQSLLYYLYLLKKAGTIPPELPVFLNSPMAVDATEIFRNHLDEHRLSTAECEAMCRMPRIITSGLESKRLNNRPGPMVILAGSGMATGGRVVHHLKAFAPDPRNTILFSGFQAGGTRGASMLQGAEQVKIHGQYVPIRAEIALIDNISAHADANEIMIWLKQFKTAPQRTFVTHGEPAAADALRLRIQEELQWDAYVPDYLEIAPL
ncbi:MBL fold metallo-hydrolase RNA specificity domain-containing protein [Nitrosospira multiformis]|uniref:MBL fold metallo-hydrolase RNA specificity domain-containing protein n=1 Tax=Nitrosospira multiformis TaxID=1231 RepID=UPI00089AC190|nr:MBL fold metallo-hydrolase [Nitrosospira multiformis]SEA57554.1 metallo-beta-lactamase family protein [Nitrosospira multiformis]